MIEPTETEEKYTLDKFVEALASILKEDPEVLHSAPHNTPVRRVNEVEAVKTLILTYKDYVDGKE